MEGMETAERQFIIYNLQFIISEELIFYYLRLLLEFKNIRKNRNICKWNKKFSEPQCTQV